MVAIYYNTIMSENQRDQQREIVLDLFGNGKFELSIYAIQSSSSIYTTKLKGLFLESSVIFFYYFCS